MSMLARFRKVDGFAQLLAVIENADPKKRETLLKSIQAEDNTWAELLKAKTFTFERFLNWSVADIAEVTQHIPAKFLANALAGTTPEQMAKVLQMVAPGTVKQIKEEMELKKPTSSEIFASRLKIVQKVREMAKDNKLNLKRIDPDVDITDVKVA